MSAKLQKLILSEGDSIIIGVDGEKAVGIFMNNGELKIKGPINELSTTLIVTTAGIIYLDGNFIKSRGVMGKKELPESDKECMHRLHAHCGLTYELCPHSHDDMSPCNLKDSQRPDVANLPSRMGMVDVDGYLVAYNERDEDEKERAIRRGIREIYGRYSDTNRRRAEVKTTWVEILQPVGGK